VKDAEIEALQRELERLRLLATRDRTLLEAIFAQSPHGIIVCDANGKLTLQNKAAERIWAGSASAENIEGWTRYRGFHPDGRPYGPGDWAMARALTTGVGVEFEEYQILRFDDTKAYLLGGCAPIFGPTGAIEGALSVFADITPLKTVSHDLRRAVQTREDLLAVVSHDLRNPLSVAMMRTAMLAKTLSNDDEGKRICRELEIVQRSCEQMQKLVGDLLDFGSIEAGTFTVTGRPESAVKLVDHAIESLRPLATSKSLQLEVKTGIADAVVSCDRERVLQVFSNLVGNAIKFTPAGGGISVETVAEAGHVRFSVTDTGPGIPDEQLPHLFERYWQGRSKSTHGVGLGLFIAKGIVLAHHGKLWVEPNRSSGAAFHFTLPIAA